MINEKKKHNYRKNAKYNENTYNKANKKSKKIMVGRKMYWN